MNYYLRNENIAIGTNAIRAKAIGDFTVTKQSQYSFTAGLPKFLIKDGTQYWITASNILYNSINEIKALSEPPEGCTPRPIFVGAYKSRLNQYDITLTGGGNVCVNWINKVWNNKELFKGTEPIIPAGGFVDRSKGNLLNYSLTERINASSCLNDLKLNEDCVFEYPLPSAYPNENCILGVPSTSAEIDWENRSFKKFVSNDILSAGNSSENFVVLNFKATEGGTDLPATFTPNTAPNDEYSYYTLDTDDLSGKSVKLKYFWTVLFTPNTITSIPNSATNFPLTWSKYISNITYNASAAINSALQLYSINGNPFVFNYQSDNNQFWLRPGQTTTGDIGGSAHELNVSYKSSVSSINGTLVNVPATTSLRCVKNFDEFDVWDDAETYKNFYVLAANNTAANSTVEDLSKLSLIVTANNGIKYLFGVGRLKAIVVNQAYTFGLSQGQSAMWVSGGEYVIGKSKRTIVSGNSYNSSDWDIIPSSNYALTDHDKYDITVSSWLSAQTGWNSFSSNFIPYYKSNTNPSVNSNLYLNKNDISGLTQLSGLSRSEIEGNVNRSFWKDVDLGIPRYSNEDNVIYTKQNPTQISDYIELNYNDYLIQGNSAWVLKRTMVFNVPDSGDSSRVNCSDQIFHRKDANEFYLIVSDDPIPNEWYKAENSFSLKLTTFWDENAAAGTDPSGNSWHFWDKVQELSPFNESSAYDSYSFVTKDNKIYTSLGRTIVGGTPFDSCWSPSSFYTIDGYKGWGNPIDFAHTNNYSYNYVGSSEFIIPASDITGSYLHLINPMTKLLNYYIRGEHFYPFITDFKFGYELCD